MKVIDEQKTFYSLATGTIHERSVPALLPGMTISGEFDKAFKVIEALHGLIERETHGRVHEHRSGMGSVVCAIWTLWSYASHDVTALRTELASTKTELASLRAEIEKLQKPSVE